MRSSEQADHVAPRGAALRRAVRFSYVAAMLWAVGNTLSSGILITYLAQDLGAQGKQLGYLYSAPALLGLLRLFTPLVIVGCGGTKRTCLAWSAAAYALLFAVVPIIELERYGVLRGVALTLLIALLCLHQLLEQVATVALWTWLTDLIPRRFRGRFFARRNMLQLAVIIPTLLLSGELVDRTIAAQRTAPNRQVGALPTDLHPTMIYGLVVSAGAALLLVSLIPLAMIPAVEARRAPTTGGTAARMGGFSLRVLFASLYEPAARRLLLYGCWFSFFNGLFSVAQNILPKAVLKLGLADMNRMQTVMRLGQIGVSAWAGPWSDRRGNRSVLVFCQLLVGAAPLFYFLASPEQPYWLYGAWILWSAYAGINICLPNLTMRLALPAERSAHLATYHALTSLFLVAGTISGGYAFDKLTGGGFHFVGMTFDKFQLFFLAAFVMRSAGAAIVATVPEPGVRSRE